MEPINLFVPKFRTEECLAEIRECLEQGWTGLGFKTVEFEGRWQDYTGLQHAHFVNSATAGLHLAIKLLKDANGWADGDDIISTPLTFAFQELDRMTGEIKNVIEALLTIDYELRKIQNLKLVFESRAEQGPG